MDLLESTVQNYAWGDRAFIAELQNRVPTGEPEAELWMGAHPKAPSVLRSSGVSLADHITTNRQTALGATSQLDTLPFLAKVLAAAGPLSIQTHPDAARAAEGFARENAAGVALDSPVRTYRDPNHKPELICAVTPFDAKCGFRGVAQTVDLFEQIGGAGVRPMLERLDQAGTEADVLADVLTWLLSLDEIAGAELTSGVADACTTASDGPWNTEIGWTHRLQALYPGDPGVIVALLLNHITLEPGQAIFLQAGVLHAYMQGAGIEIMANSDNVIRGGLTGKHVDTDELAALVETEPALPPVQNPEGQVHTFYAPVSEFDLTRVEVSEGVSATVSGPEILIATEGEFRVATSTSSVGVSTGSPVWIDAADEAWTAEGDGVLFRVTVPT